jgi:hypothetical protein
MKALLTILLLTTVLTGAAQAQNYAFFKAVDDAYVDSAFPGQNFGQATDLYLGDRTPAGGGSCLFFVQFDISDFAASNDIYLAELWLSKHEKYGSPTQQCSVDVHHITTPGWDENLITWNTQPAYNATPSAGSTGTFNPPGQVYFDVTADVIADKDSGITGFAVKMSPEIQWLWLNFWSAEQVPLPDFRPTLEIYYTGPVATEESSLDAVKALYR